MHDQSASPAEVARFSALADKWWDLEGPMKPLHATNSARLEYLARCCGDLQGKQVIDVGCGGGIASESMAVAGADVLGIDASAELIEVASQHARQAPKNRKLALEYQCASLEDTVRDRRADFDIVCAFEVVEHVPQPQAFVASLVQLVKPGGHLVMSTINRTTRAFALAIVGAEYIAGILPKGTHRYDMLIQPQELADWARSAGGCLVDCSGMFYNPFTATASLVRLTAVNYLACFGRA